MKLKDEVAIVTGSTTGIGVAIAHLAAAEGAKVVVTGRRESGESVAADIRKEGNEAIFVQADISVEEDVKRLVDKAAEEFRTPDRLDQQRGTDRSSWPR